MKIQVVELFPRRELNSPVGTKFELYLVKES